MHGGRSPTQTAMQDRREQRRLGADRQTPCEDPGEFADGYYHEPTVLKGDSNMRVFQEEIFGPVLATRSYAGIRKASRLPQAMIHIS